MNEQTEKQLAEKLGDLMDADAAVSRAAEAGALREALEAVEILRSGFCALPEMDATAAARRRARLVAAASRRRWPVPTAIAAALVLAIIFPVFISRNFQHRKKMALLDKYDKIYITQVAPAHRSDYLEKRLAPFRAEHERRVRDMQLRLRLERVRKLREQFRVKKEPL